jgi:hypothetical protein
MEACHHAFARAGCTWPHGSWQRKHRVFAVNRAQRSYTVAGVVFCCCLCLGFGLACVEALGWPTAATLTDLRGFSLVPRLRCRRSRSGKPNPNR